MRTRGTISLVFDDGYEVVYRHVLPLLNRWQIPAVFALPLDHAAVERTEDRATVPWERWLHAREAGHELAAHGITHRSFLDLDQPALDEELAVPARTLPATTLVYPGGGVNSAVKEAAAAYYQAARSTVYGIESLPPRDALALRTVNYTRNNFSVARANWRALWACATNRWLIETYHLVDDAENARVHSVRLTAFRHHLAFIRRLPIRVVTIAGALQGMDVRV